jgi:hypothetical protein
MKVRDSRRDAPEGGCYRVELDLRCVCV